MKRSSQWMMSLLAVVPLLSPAVLQAQEAPVYGRELMTEQELQEHRETMRNLETPKERAEYRAEHREQMEERARERGVELAEPRSGTEPRGPADRAQPAGQARGNELMNEQERAEHRERMRETEDAESREEYRRETHERMEERARERDMTLPDSPMDRGGPGGGRGMGGR